MFKVSKKKKEKEKEKRKNQKNVSNIIRVNIQDRRTTSGAFIVNFKHMSHFILLLILPDLNKKSWLGLRNG